LAQAIQSEIIDTDGVARANRFSSLLSKSDVYLSVSIVLEFRWVNEEEVDMAVGIIIAGAFGTIVKSLVSDVIMPPIGLALGGGSYESLDAARKPGPRRSTTVSSSTMSSAS
jgi:hypothetical protein